MTQLSDKGSCDIGIYVEEFTFMSLNDIYQFHAMLLKHDTSNDESFIELIKL
jgi:hypothetical protein